LTRATLQDEIVNIWENDRKTVLLITNDVDEGLLMADRIIPLSAGPGATLGPSIDIDIPRPRDRKGINHHPRFKEIRRDVIGYLTATRKNIASGSKPVRSLPQLLPLDLSRRAGTSPISKMLRRLISVGDAT
jgi:nitrate/nitrite transport system ATP-binding protein